MTIGPTLTTARLILRPPQHEDFDGFAAMAQEEDTMRFIGGVSPRDAAWRGMASLAGSWAVHRRQEWRGKVVEIEVSADERAMFDYSVGAVRGLIDACKGIDPSVA